MSDQYETTYCVTCRQKTNWSCQPTLKQTRNCKAGLRGTCCKCNKTKFTFVTTCYYRTKRFGSTNQTSPATVAPATSPDSTEDNKTK